MSNIPLFNSIADFQKYLPNSKYHEYNIRFELDGGGSYFLLLDDLGYRVLVKEPGRSDVYYDGVFKSLNDAVDFLLKYINK